MSVLDKTPRVAEEIAKYPRPTSARPLAYGTAGFREDAELLAAASHRLGMLAVLRSKREGKISGVMITASHNPASDNGLKLIDSRGEMLHQSWEKYATQLVNAPSDKVVEVLNAVVAAEKIDLDHPGNVFIAKDTRPSSEHLSELVREGALVIGGNVLDFGLQTTPQLHHLVRMWNYEQYNKGDWASEVGYYNMLSDGFKQLTASIDTKKLEMRAPLYVDCAHGVGALQLTKLAKDLGDSLHVEIFNTPTDGELNSGCGAEFVEKSRASPSGVNKDADRGKRFCSLDGDADRFVFHYLDEASGKFHLLDGNKIACLFADFFAEKLRALELLDAPDGSSSVSFGVVQTAYANGASTRFLESRGIRVVRAKTGVKHCHHAAVSNFDVAVYFEANGHGTVVLRDSLVEKLHKWENALHDERKKLALSHLLAAQQLLNQATGDALSGLLLVEALLLQRNWSIADWDNMYQDLPSRQQKVAVADRGVVVVDDVDESVVRSPEKLRDALSDLVQRQFAGKQARAFARPSGTEKAVRVYAEAATQEDADALAEQVARLVTEVAGGDAPASESVTEFTA